MASDPEGFMDELAGEDWTDPLNRRELLRFLRRCSPRTRSSVIRTIEGRASADQVAFIKEHIETMEPDATVRVVDYVAARTCDFGHLLDEQNRLIATTDCCGALTCSAEGCSLNCIRCGRSLCRRHAAVFSDGEVYCPSCKSSKWLRIGLRATGTVAKWCWEALWRP